MLKVIIPLAGSSDLFNPSEYFYPKPLIEIKGKPMIEVVLESIKDFSVDYEIIFIIKEEDAKKFFLDNTLKILSEKAKIVQLKNATQGALCSVLMAIDIINDEDELIIINGDQIINESFDKIYQNWKTLQSDAGLLTFKSVHPRWSYVKIKDNHIIETAEKNPISNHAIAGYYYIRRAKDFFEAAFNVILNEQKINSSYFISSAFNELILNNKKINFYEIPSENYISFYSPEKITQYERRR